MGIVLPMESVVPMVHNGLFSLLVSRTVSTIITSGNISNNYFSLGKTQAKAIVYVCEVGKP